MCWIFIVLFDFTMLSEQHQRFVDYNHASRRTARLANGFNPAGSDRWRRCSAAICGQYRGVIVGVLWVVII